MMTFGGKELNLQRPVYLLLLLLSSFCARPLFAASGSFALKTTETAIFSDDEASVEAGEYFRHVILLRGTLRFSGEAEEIVILGGKLILRSGARVTKSVVLMGGSLEQEDGAKVVPESVDIKAPQGWYRILLLAFPIAALLFSGWLWFLASGVWILCSWLTGLFLFWCFPLWRDRIVQLMNQEKARSALWAFGAVMFFVPGLLFLVISILGIALIPLYIALFSFVYYLSHIVGADWLGRQMARLFPKGLKWEWSLLLGLVVSIVLGTLLPGLGKFFLFALSFIASGVVWRTWAPFGKKGPTTAR